MNKVAISFNIIAILTILFLPNSFNYNIFLNNELQLFEGKRLDNVYILRSHLTTQMLAL